MDSFKFCILLILALSTYSVDIPPSSDRIDALLAKMTIEEKVGQLNQYNGFFDATGPAPTSGDQREKYNHIKAGRVGAMLNVRGVESVRKMQELAVDSSRLGIPMLFGFDVIHGYHTAMPIPLAEAASWDLRLIEESARIAAKEAAADGINWTFAPMVDISRDARWGRVMEGAGEDPFLGSKVAGARVRGFQGEDLSNENSIAACAKHFAAYGFAESGKDYNTADIGTSTLYNVVLPPFRACKDENVQTFMNAFNDLNGVPATGNAWLQREILKGKWGFEGFVVSDWGSIKEMQDHGVSATNKEAALLAMKAGCDMDMESYIYVHELDKLFENGELDISILDEAVKRILRVKENLGLFEDPYKYCKLADGLDSERMQAHRSFSKKIAQNSIVLLKNESGLLPLKKSGRQKIGVIGHLAESKNSPLGNWSLAAESHSAVSFLEGLKSVKHDHIVSYSKGPTLYEGKEQFIHELSINKNNTSGIQESIDLAQNSDILFVVIGEHGLQSGEGRSRADISLPGLQEELLKKLYNVNQNIVLILMNGRPLAIEWANENIPAIVETWHLGAESGNAIAEVVFGNHNPCGKLPMTFPRNVGQVPIYYNYKPTGRPGPKDLVFWSHYTDEKNEPLYPFGFGLSYSKFAYDNLEVNVREAVNVQVELKNNSSVDGHEIVQLYIRDKFASTSRPVKELKGFRKVFLAANESKKLLFTLSKTDLSFYDNTGNLVFENGAFDIMIGGSSNELLLKEVDVRFE